MDDTRMTHLRDLWLTYRRRTRALERARVQLDEGIELALSLGVKQADIARLLGTTRQDVQESRRRQARRKGSEIP
jgi:hypothetical protein